MRIRTLRGRLIGWHLGVVAVSLVLFSVLLHQALSRSLYRHHDGELAADAERLAPTLANVDFTSDVAATNLASASMPEEFVIIRDLHGRMLYRSPLLQVSEPNIGQHEALVHAAAAGATTPLFFTADLERTGSVRFICVPIGTPARAYLQVGRPLGDVPATLNAVMTACATLVPIILVVMSFSGWVIARRALAPMQMIDETLQAIQATDLSRRIDVPADDELGRLVLTLNRLLDRLEKAFASLKQFTADVSHQLQTPLTIMKGNAELALGSAQTPAEYQRTLAVLGEEVDEMARVLADLRALTLADAGLEGRDRGSVNLAEIATEAVEIVEALAEAKEILVEAAIEPGVTVWGNRVALKQVLLNLGDNAVKYTPARGRIRVELAARDQDAVVTVSDTGVGIRQEELTRVFDRFYRGERGDNPPVGTGLGLAIVKRILEVHGGSITVQSQPGQGSTFEVRLPRKSQ